MRAGIRTPWFAAVAASALFCAAVAPRPAQGARNRTCVSLLADQGDVEIVMVLMAVRAKVAGQILAPTTVQAVEDLVDIPLGTLASGNYDPDTLVPEIFDALVYEKGSAMTARLQAGLETSLSAIGRIIDSAHPTVVRSPDVRVKTDQDDILRGYGFLLLRRMDPVFDDPKYLMRYFRQRRVAGVSEWGVDDVVHAQSIHAEALEGWKRAYRNGFADLTSTLSRTSFDKLYFQSGSDANNALFEIANHYASVRTNRKVKDAEILFFDGTYGAGRGKMHSRSFYSAGYRDSPQWLPAPYTKEWDPQDPREIARLRPLEDAVLERIRRKAARKSNPVGGVFLEPIVGAFGVMFYRPEFLKRLRALCDELRIPIFADEILTGGGRTGKFFAFEHYPGFEPDYFTYGKGLMIAGIGHVLRFLGPQSEEFLVKSAESYVGNYNTLQASADALLKSAYVITRIAEGHLERNAAETGEYLLQRLRENGFPNARGKGLLINPSGLTAHDDTQMQWRLRFMPYLDLTRVEADRIVTEANTNLKNPFRSP